MLKCFLGQKHSIGALGSLKLNEALIPLLRILLLLIFISSLLQMKLAHDLGILVLEQSPPKENESSPCKIAISNGVPFHEEILESIVEMFPLEVLLENMPPSCDNTKLLFDFHLYSVRPSVDSEEYSKVLTWIQYFYSTMQSRVYSKINLNGATFTKQIGTLVSEGQAPLRQDAHHVMIEASCLCPEIDTYGQVNFNYATWLAENTSRFCIVHEKCSALVGNYRSFWLSPYHPRYFIPTTLPKLVTAKRVNSPFGVCILGEVSRRDWGYLHSFLSSPKARGYFGNFRILILGRGDYPVELVHFRNMTSLTRISDFANYFATVETTCTVVLHLLSLGKCRDYFNIEGSMLRLSGPIATVISYELSFVIHEDLFAVYKNHLPLHKPYATHGENHSSFVEAVCSVFDAVGKSTNI
mmetsp:Transcript_30926/g.47412  ORF Transcript_30926/g.47412 Transcript_30926/m.47412 type:complete len:412 (-) Transcript_30926:68-1303(-)